MPNQRIETVIQESVNCGLQAKFGPLLALWIKFYWDPDTPICPGIVCGCFFFFSTVRVDLSHFKRPTEPFKFILSYRKTWVHSMIGHIGGSWPGESCDGRKLWESQSGRRMRDGLEQGEVSVIRYNATRALMKVGAINTGRQGQSCAREKQNLTSG